MAATSKFIRTLRDATGATISGANVWVTPQADTYPTNAQQLTESTTNPGYYSLADLADGEYKIWIDSNGGTSPLLYDEHIWHGEDRLTTIANHFDATDAYKLKVGGIQNPIWMPRNLFITSGGIITYDKSTYTFTWSADLIVQNGLGGWCSITAGSLIMTDGYAAYITMSDTITGGQGAKTIIQEDWNSISTVIGNSGIVVLANRYNDNVYGFLMDAFLSGAANVSVRNPGLITNGKVFFDETVGKFYWTGTLYFFNGKGGYVTIPSGGITILGDEILYIDGLPDWATTGYGTTTVKTSVWNSSLSVADNLNVHVIAYNAYGGVYGELRNLAEQSIGRQPNNRFIMDGGDIVYDRASGTLSWSNTLYILKGNGYYVALAAGSFTLDASNRCAYLTYDMSLNTTVENKTVADITIVSGWTNADVFKDNRILLGAWDGDDKFYSPLLELALQDKFDKNGLTANAVDDATVTVTVKKSGGDYSTIASALAAITDASYSKPYIIEIYEGVYEEIHLQMKDYVSLRGMSRDKCQIKGYYPASTAQATIQDNSTIEMHNGTTSQNVTLENLTITGQNCRYVIHNDAGSSVYSAPATQKIKNCHIEHLGNDEADAYWGTSVWDSQDAFGGGESWGTTIIAKNSSFISKNKDGFACHTAANSVTMASKIYLENCECVTNDITNNAARFMVLGSKQDDQIIIKNCSFNNHFWFKYSQQDYNKLLPNTIIASGIEDFICKMTLGDAYNYKMFTITSNSLGTSSTIRVSGDAVDDLMLNAHYFDGAVDINGYVYGELNTAFITLGQRLGDCSVINKTLIIDVDGGVSQTIAFNEDFTAQTNDYILNFINISLTGALASTTYQYIETFYPKEINNLKKYKNNEIVSIFQGMAVKQDDSFSIKKMLNTDLASDFLGIAMENIVPGGWGDVKIKGVIQEERLNMSATTTAIFGDVFGISSTAGKVVEGGSPIILKCIYDGQLKLL